MSENENGKKQVKIRRSPKSVFKKCVSYPLQLVALVPVCLFFRLLPLPVASAVGGFLGRLIGPKVKESWAARYNLMRAFPKKTPEEIDKIVVEMWDNIGRTFLEYPHLRNIVTKKQYLTEIVNVDRAWALKNDGKAGILFSGHFGNWETSSVLGNIIDLPLHRVYRYANNPFTEWLFRYYRAKTDGELIPKTLTSMRIMVEKIRKKEHLALIIDQKMNKGTAAPLFGRDAMTTPALAHLALKFDIPVLPVRIQRLKGAHYRLTCEEFLKFEKTGDKEADIYAALCQMNATFERWIKDDPAQWLWVHKRWPDSKEGAKWLYAHRKEWKKGKIPAPIPAELN